MHIHNNMYIVDRRTHTNLHRCHSSISIVTFANKVAGNVLTDTVTANIACRYTTLINVC